MNRARSSIDDHISVQSLAKSTLDELLNFIRPGVTEQQIALTAKDVMRRLGINDFWYHGVAALVLVGKRTTMSVSGRDYELTSTAVRSNDLVTIDLSPAVGKIWGDYARSIFVEDGIASLQPNQTNVAWHRGFEMEVFLHDQLIEMATPNMTAHELWHRMNRSIEAHGFENLDFQRNLGHSIEQNLDDRVYIERGNRKRLSEFGLFTFEPHICEKGSDFGYKHEDIFFFSDGSLKAI